MFGQRGVIFKATKVRTEDKLTNGTSEKALISAQSLGRAGPGTPATGIAVSTDPTCVPVTEPALATLQQAQKLPERECGWDTVENTQNAELPFWQSTRKAVVPSSKAALSTRSSKQHRL